MNILKSILISMLIVKMSLSIELEVNRPNKVILEKNVNPITTELPHEW